MSLFQTVKDNVTTRQAAELYGLKVGHGGMCKCPFHVDRNPSMKVDTVFQLCFAFGLDGGETDEFFRCIYNSVTLSYDTLKKYFPKSYTAKQMEKVIIRLLDNWLKKRQQTQEL